MFCVYDFGSNDEKAFNTRRLKESEIENRRERKKNNDYFKRLP